MSENARSGSAGTSGRLRELSERLERLPTPPGIDERLFAKRELEKRLRAVARRLGEGPEAPARVAVFGPTGAGKSKLFNSLVGRELSPSGYRRPFTRRSVRSEALPGCVLIDSTDFDSVEAENREEAEAVFEEADAFVFVAEAQKYADRATWEYLRRVYDRGGPIALVLNKVTSDAERQDFSRRLESAFGAAARAAELVAIPELAIDDRALFRADDPAVRTVLGAVHRLVEDVPARRALRARRLACDLEAALGAWEAGRERLAAYSEGLARLSERLDARFRSAIGDL
ncbi:MAG: GTPase, partial [Planctomycetota bacterium]